MTKKAPKPAPKIANTGAAMDEENRTSKDPENKAARLGLTGNDKKRPDEDDADALRAYEQGRTAHMNSISRDEPPFGDDDKLLKHWQNGHDSVKV